MFFANFSGRRTVSQDGREGTTESYLMDGGAPAGINSRPGEDGCLTKMMRISRTTRHGNSKTNPNGIEIEEFPFSRIRRRKKDNWGSNRPLSLLRSSSAGRLGEDGIRFASPCKNPIASKDLSPIGRLSRSRPANCCIKLVSQRSIMPVVVPEYSVQI